MSTGTFFIIVVGCCTLVSGLFKVVDLIEAPKK